MSHRRDRVGTAGLIVFGIAWLISIGLSIAFLGVVIWAIIQVVNHYT